MLVPHHRAARSRLAPDPQGGMIEFMELTSRDVVRGEDALALAALHLLGEGATATSLAERFGAHGAVIEHARVAALLRRLVGLGLAYTPAVRHGDAYYVRTALGKEYTNVSLAGRAEMAARLEELEHLWTDLLATMAHELRTPLTAVRTCIGLLLDPSSTPDVAAREQLLQTIERSAERMQRMLTDLLDLAWFCAGGI
jgi:signal transduction histidine kinase